MRRELVKNHRCTGSIISVVYDFQSEIYAIIDGNKYNTKSIMNTTIIDKAKNIDFVIEGVDEDMAAEQIRKFYS